GEVGVMSGWDGSADATLKKLRMNGIEKSVARVKQNIIDAEKSMRATLRCDTPQADPGCHVAIRYLYQVIRALPNAVVFAQMVTGFEATKDPATKVVGLNMVAPEDQPTSMQNFAAHMQMLKALRALYPAAHLSLHAGELAPGLVTPEGLTFHIRDSVE